MCFPVLGEQHMGSNHIRYIKLHQKEKNTSLWGVVGFILPMTLIIV